MADSKVISSASNSRVKPLSGLAHAGVEVGLVLEEVQMAPGHPLGVVGRAVGGGAMRTGEAAAGGEVDLDVEPLCRGIEVAAGHAPGRGQAQGQLQQVGVAHRRASAVARPERRLAPCSPPSSTLRAAQRRGGLRPCLTAAARGARGSSGRDEETPPVSRTKKPLRNGKC
jgi:hypothetical protein